MEMSSSSSSWFPTGAGDAEFVVPCSGSSTPEPLQVLKSLVLLTLNSLTKQTIIVTCTNNNKIVIEISNHNQILLFCSWDGTSVICDICRWMLSNADLSSSENDEKGGSVSLDIITLNDQSESSNKLLIFAICNSNSWLIRLVECALNWMVMFEILSNSLTILWNRKYWGTLMNVNWMLWLSGVPTDPSLQEPESIYLCAVIHTNSCHTTTFIIGNTTQTICTPSVRE